jgi:hypothetical protein
MSAVTLNGNMIYELERMWKETAMTCLTILQNWLRGFEEIYEKPLSAEFSFYPRIESGTSR